MHEFTILDRGRRALLTSAYDVFYDLDRVSVAHMSAMIDGPVFQEIDIESGNTVFEWKGLDHLPPSLTVMDAPSSKDSSWDWLLVLPFCLRFCCAS